MSDFISSRMADHLSAFALNNLIQITIIILVMLLLARWFSNRAAMRHGILISTVILVLLCPLVVLSLQTNGIGINVSQIVKPPSIVHTQQPVDFVESSESSKARNETVFHTTELLLQQKELNEEATPQVVLGKNKTAATSSWNQYSFVGVPVDLFRIAIGVFLFAWFFGAALLLFRFLVGLYRLIAILRSSLPNTDQALGALFSSACQLVGARQAQLTFSDRVAGPIAAGFFSPQVILPIGFSQKIGKDQLEQIFVHEIAHLVRKDQVVVLLQNLLGVFFWIHPLVRILNRQLAQAREEVCDNHVLAVADARSYSQTLLSLAKMAQPTATLSGEIGLFSSQWKLENRVAGLLSSKRQNLTSLRLSGRAMVGAFSLVLAIIVSSFTVTAALQENSNAVKHEFSGSVTDSKGNPVVADVYLVGGGQLERKSVLLGSCDTNGEFDFKFAESEEGELNNATLLATAPNHGMSWIMVSDFTVGKIQLTDDIPIVGRVFNSTGKPFAGAKVEALDVRAMNDGNLSPYLEAVKSGSTIGFEFDKYLSKPPNAETVTNMNGEFELGGFGSNRIVAIKISGPGIASEIIQVMTKNSSSVKTIGKDRPWAHVNIKGANFEHKAKPSRQIRGVVTDSKTGQPQPNVRVSSSILGQFAYVRSGGLGGRAEDSVFSENVTDKNGRFELDGVAKERNHWLLAKPDNGTHLKSYARVDGGNETEAEPIEVALKVNRGTTIRGRIIDEVSGAPVRASVKYFPVFPNEKIAEDQATYGKHNMMGGAWSETTTDANGEYTIPVHPGAGCIVVAAMDRARYRSANVDALKFFKDKIDYENAGKLVSFDMPRDTVIYVGSKSYRSPGLILKRRYNAIELMMVDPATAGEKRLDLKLTPAPIVRGQVVDPEGRPLDNVAFTQLYSKGPKQSKDGTFSIAGLGEDEIRSVVFLQHERKLVAFQKIGKADAGKPLTIKTQPWGEVKGRLIGEHAKWLRNQVIESVPKDLKADNAGILTDFFTTNEEGEFHIVGLVPGKEYRLVPTNYPFVGAPEVIVVAKSGEVVDAGDVVAVSAIRRAREQPGDNH